MLRCCLPAIRCLGVFDGCATNLSRCFLGGCPHMDKSYQFHTARSTSKLAGFTISRLGIERGSRLQPTNVSLSENNVRDDSAGLGVDSNPCHPCAQLPGSPPNFAASIGDASLACNLPGYIATPVVGALRPDSSAQAVDESSATGLKDAISETLTPVTTASDKLPAIDILRQFLQVPDYGASDSPKHTPNTLRSLYKSSKHRSQLSQLSSAQFSRLAGIFGTLSFPDPPPQCIYVDSSVSYLPGAHSRTYWPFVVQILQDKRRHGFILDPMDNFWLMRAALAVLDPAGGIDHIESILARARRHYDKVSRHIADAELHVPYWDALLLDHTHGLAEIVHRLVQLLGRPGVRDAWPAAFFWTLILKQRSSAPSQLKQFLLDNVSTLMSAQRDHRQHDRDLPPCDYARIASTSLNVQTLSKALAGALLPSAAPKLMPPTQRWAAKVAKRALGAHSSLETRWINLQLLAFCMTSRDHPEGSPTVKSPTMADPGAVDWQTVLTLATLEKHIGEGQQGLVARQARIQWEVWKQSGAGCPDMVARAIVSSFFGFASLAGDVPFKDDLHQYALQTELYLSGGVGASLAQARGLAVDYIVALRACGSTRWADAFTSLGNAGSQHGLVDAVLSRLFRLDVSAAQSLYRYAVDRCIPLSPQSVHMAAMSFASSPSFEMAIPHLVNSTSAKLLGAVLHSFMLSGRETLSPEHIRIIAAAMAAVYASESPSPGLKHPIRNMILVLAASRHAPMVLDIAKCIHRSRPSFLTCRFLYSLFKVLLRCRQHRSTVRILETVSTTLSATELSKLRETVVLQTARSGVSSMARRAFIRSHSVKLQPTQRESLFRFVGFNPRKPRPLSVLRVVAKGYRNLADSAVVIECITILVRAKRLFAARKLLGRACDHMDTAGRTHAGNIILHGYVLRTTVQNRRLVRTVLKMSTLLAQQYKFERDRITVNTILKALLRWKSFITVVEVKALFDHMVRGGYPAAPRFRLRGAPFETAPQTASALTLPPLKERISFERHVRPMYKMFVKAFHIRGDKRAAAMVIGILKAEEAAVRARREARNRARLLGRMKAKLEGRR